MATTIWGTSSSWLLTALPLFVWIGEILLGQNYQKIYLRFVIPWMQKLPGGLIHVNVVIIRIIFSCYCRNSWKNVNSRTKKENYPEKILLGEFSWLWNIRIINASIYNLIIYGVTVQGP